MESERAIDLVRELAEIMSSCPRSLEILPGGLAEWEYVDIVEANKRPTLDFPFLYSEGNLGIPKKVLYKLYMTAVSLFKSSRSVPELCRISTSIILFTNPAHQTALNARKRLVQNGDLDPEKELEFTEVLFRGSSDCAKQSILWDHRRWSFGRLYTRRLHLGERSPSHKWTTSADLQPLPDIPPDVIIHEFSIIRKACESHPRNYHAWTHWHFITDIVSARLLVPKDFSDVYLDLLTQEFNALSHWINHHVSDHSAMYHLCSLGRLFEDPALHFPDALPSNVTNSSLVERAFSLIQAYPSHESLWLYLRESATHLSPDRRRTLVEQVESSSMSQSPLAKRFVAWTSDHVFHS